MVAEVRKYPADWNAGGDAASMHSRPTLSATCPAPPPQAPVGGFYTDADGYPDVTSDWEPDLPPGDFAH